jgi:hypothetical protein
VKSENQKKRHGRWEMERCKPGTWVTANSRYMGDSGVDSSVTGSRHKGDSELGRWATNCRHMGDEGPVAETVDVRDMGDTEAARSADALENNVSHG